MTILKIKLYIEIQEWYFKIANTSKYVHISQNLKGYPDFNVTSIIIMWFNQIYIMDERA